MEPELEDFLRTVLEEPIFVGDYTWPDGARPIVLKVSDRFGGVWFVKRHLLSDGYQAELTAYRRWTRALGERVPRLHASDNRLRVLVITALPGATPKRWEEPALQHQAGHLLRTLHEAEPYPPLEDIIARTLQQLEQVAASAKHLLKAAALDFARSSLHALEGIPQPRRVPCHLDYSPRNWLVDNGRLRVFDFGDAAPDAWINDFGRLFIGWSLPPEPREAFIEGYGRTPSADDLALLAATYAARLISHIIVARQRGYSTAEAGCRRVLQALIHGAE